MSGMKLLLLLPLAAAPLLVPGITHVGAPAAGNGAVREELTIVYGRWSEARTSYDRATFEELLAPDFFVQLAAKKMTRAEFVAEISEKHAGALLVRFDPDILTLSQDKDGTWVAVITEKLEFEGPLGGGKPGRVYSFWVTRDRFKKTGADWQVLSSEALGNENWSGGEVPPFPDWKS